MKRLNELINLSTYNQYLEKNQQREKERIFCKHDWNHLINVGRITYIMVLEEELTERLLKKWQLNSRKDLKEIIYTTALLHDIGRWKEYDTGQDHAEASAKLAIDLLQKCNFSDLERKVILTGIKEHRGEATTDKSILGKLLCQADNLARNCKDCSARQECKGIKNPIIQY